MPDLLFLFLRQIVSDFMRTKKQRGSNFPFLSSGDSVSNTKLKIGL